MLGRGLDELERDQLEAALLEAGDDGADEAALDAVGLRAEIAQISDCACTCALRLALTMM